MLKPLLKLAKRITEGSLFLGVLKKNIDPETTLCREVKLRVRVSRENRNV